MNLTGYVSTVQAAEILGIKLASVYTYVARMPEFPQPVKVGRTLLFDREALLDWRMRHPRNGTRRADTGTSEP